MTLVVCILIDPIAEIAYFLSAISSFYLFHSSKHKNFFGNKKAIKINIQNVEENFEESKVENS